jgi:hypothetical protein
VVGRRDLRLPAGLHVRGFDEPFEADALVHLDAEDEADLGPMLGF